jgi:hypothetical protein
MNDNDGSDDRRRLVGYDPMARTEFWHHRTGLAGFEVFKITERFGDWKNLRGRWEFRVRQSGLVKIGTIGRIGTMVTVLTMMTIMTIVTIGPIDRI